MTSYKGIDYGRGITNRNAKMGIRYGVINQGEVLQAWADSSEPFYIYTCPYCGTELRKGQDAKRCPDCYKGIDSDTDFDFLEPSSFFLDDEEYTAEQSSGDCDIFITRSPYFTYCQLCSPCAPGAGYLMNPLEEPDENNRTYCFGHDWFDSGTAPYPVYDVKTGKIVEGTNNKENTIEPICPVCGKEGHPCYDICREAGWDQGYNMDDPKDQSRYCEFCPECGHCCN